MSRIHEALLRADRERAQTASQEERLPQPVLEAPPSVLEPPSEEVEPSAAEAMLAEAQVLHVPPALEPDEPLTAQSILANCIRGAWKPERIHGLFLQGDDDYARGMEEFRTLRTRLYRQREKRGLRTLLVASGMPGEGKSFIAANLSQVLARQRGRRVLLIDGDLRWSRLHQYLGTPDSPGLVEYLAGKATEEQVIRVGPDEHLYFIAGGTQTSNPAELLGNGRLKRLIERVAHIFDWIVIDTPPVVGVSDAALMAAVVDGIILVIDSGRTDCSAAVQARQEFKDRPLLGVVLNRVAKSSTEKYGYGAYRYYGPSDSGPQQNGAGTAKTKTKGH